MVNKDFYVYGDSKILNDDSLKLAIVGSRSILPYTKEILLELFNELKNFNICIVSGGMYGVDMFSHNLALANNMKTIFVLPQGIDSYKSSSLYSQIKFKPDSRFLFLSNYSNDNNCKKYMFLERNKHIVNLSNSVLVAQASIKSGSISTGYYAKKVKKKTYCIPFSLENKQFQGTNMLINEGLSIYLNPESILESLNLTYKNLDNLIKETLKMGPLNLEDMLSELGAEYHLVEKSVFKLILKGEIFFDGVNYHL